MDDGSNWLSRMHRYRLTPCSNSLCNAADSLRQPESFRILVGGKPKVDICARNLKHRYGLPPKLLIAERSAGAAATSCRPLPRRTHSDSRRPGPADNRYLPFGHRPTPIVPRTVQILSRALNAPARFGSRGSEVQILSPRPRLILVSFEQLGDSRLNRILRAARGRRPAPR